jgi:glycosyltransferase involved in cell wall biosynthesis|tara:strand:- start:2078 stop:2959 length:882 start_codon:yes stop_codon:yes gene_type:complete
MSTVSVVIPTFNREGFIEQCVVSALQQSKKPDEVIVVDDGSSDKTWDVLRTLGFSDSKEERNSLRYIFQRNKGVSAARNLGIKAAKFRYIAFLDSDDLWLEKKLEKQISSLESQSIRYRLSHTNEIWVRNGVRVNAHLKHEKNGGDIFIQCLKLCCISPSSSLVDRSVFDDFGFFDENLPACEDYDFWLRFCAFEDVHFVNEHLLIKNGGHDQQLSKKHWGMDRFRVTALENLLKNQSLSEFKRKETIKELIFKLQVLIDGGRKRKKDAFVKKLDKKKTMLEAILSNERNGKV